MLESSIESFGACGIELDIYCPVCSKYIYYICKEEVTDICIACEQCGHDLEVNIIVEVKVKESN